MVIPGGDDIPAPIQGNMGTARKAPGKPAVKMSQEKKINVEEGLEKLRKDSEDGNGIKKRKHV
jgi:hypothetical protein